MNFVPRPRLPNLEGEIYLYGDWPPSGIKTGHAHHLYWDKWLDSKYDVPKVSYDPRFTARSQFPCIELRGDIHLDTHNHMEETWFKPRFNGKRSSQLSVAEWQSISVSEMDDLAEKFLSEAKQRGANIGNPRDILNQMKNWDIGWLTEKLRKPGCL